MGCLYYPPKQTSVSAATMTDPDPLFADSCAVIACYGNAKPEDVQAIMSAIDDYAERETGNREDFWNKPYGAG
jgi:hypothetical protein